MIGLWATSVVGWITGVKVAALPSKVEKEALSVLEDAVEAALAAYNLEVNPSDKVAITEEEFRDLIVFAEEKLTGAKFPFTREDILAEFKSRNYIVQAPNGEEIIDLPGLPGGLPKRALLGLAILGIGGLVVLSAKQRRQS